MPYQENTPSQAADQAANPNLMAWLRLARAGLATFPAGPDKRPLLRDWQGKATTDTAQIRRWAARWPDAIPALPTGTMNGVSVLDLDLRDDGRDGIKAAADLGLDVSRTFTVRTPSGGLHAYYRHRDGVKNAASHLPAGMDVRAEGGFVIAPGAVLPDGRSYRIRGEVSLAELELLRRWPAVLMPPPRVEREDTPRDREHDDLSADDLRAILAELAEAPRMANGDRPWIEDRSGNVKVGMALHHWSGGSAEGFALWREHAEQSTRYKGAPNLRQQWESFRDKPDGVTMGSLIIAAPEWCEARHAAEIDAMFLDDPDGEDDVAEDAARAKPGVGLLTFTAPADLSLKTARRPIIKGLIAAGDVGCIVGAPGVGKSLIAPRLAWAVAQGDGVFGLKVRQAHKVFYVAAEDEHGMRARMVALRERHGDAPDLRLVGGVSDLLSKGAPQMKALLAAVKAERPALVIIDTLAMAFPGLEENSAEGMGRVVAVARALAQWGAAVLMVHHDTKDGQQGLPRGHSLLNGALDVSLHLKRGDSGIVRGTLTKNRNGSCDLDIAFRIGVVELGHDEDGEAVTAGICEPCAADQEARKPKLSRNELAALTALRNIAESDGRAPLNAWRELCVKGTEVFSSDTEKARGVRFLECRKALVVKDRISVADDVVQVLGFGAVTAADFEDDSDE